jgi:phage nucleotide-binding protein
MPSVEFSSFNEYFTNFCPHLMFYGYNGTGKTSLAGKTGLRTILLDCGDAGVITLRNRPKNLKIIRIKNILHYLDAVEKACRFAAKGQLDLLVVDTLTGLQSKAIREVKGKRNFEMNQRKWGQVSSRVIECIAETRNFPKDVIYLAQEKRKGRAGEDSTVDISPSIQPATREFLSGCVDWVGRIYIDEDEKRKLSFVLTDSVEAKDRGEIFPKTIVLGKPENIYPQVRKRIVSLIHG